MLLGLDFDNTIVCYNNAVSWLADKLLDLPSDLPRTKIALRNFLRKAGRESEWTSFQGALYGPGLVYAEPFEQAVETIKVLKDTGYSLCIVSHRSTQPYAGPAYNLHKAAREWVEERLVNSGLIDTRAIYFYETHAQKIAAVKKLGCNVFLDDLPEVLGAKDFPATCKTILFDPENSHYQLKYLRIARWAELPPLLRDLI